jgi:hypothetical protein
MQIQDVELQSAIGTLALTGKPVDDITERTPPREWMQRPAPQSTHILWIVGHLATTRELLVQTLTGAPAVNLNPLFAGGSPLHDDEAYPAAPAVAAIWREAGVRVDQTLKAVSLRDLQRPSPEGVPTFNGRISGALAASVFHEAYHVGQLG